MTTYTYLEVKERNELLKKGVVPNFLVSIDNYDSEEDEILLSNGQTVGVDELEELIMEEDCCVANIDAIKDWQYFHNPAELKDNQLRYVVVDRVMIEKADGRYDLSFELVEDMLKGIYEYQKQGYMVIVDYPNHYAIATKRHQRVIFTDLEFGIIDGDGLFKDTQFGYIDLGLVDTREMDTMVAMFRGCTKLKYLNISNIETVNDMTEAFSYCVNLKRIEAKRLDMDDVEVTLNMLLECPAELVTKPKWIN